MSHIKVKNPYTGEVIAELNQTPVDEIENIFSKAESAFKVVSSLTNYERYEILKKVAEIVEDDKERFTKNIVYESGKTVREARGEVERCIQTLTLSAEAAKHLGGEVVPITGAPGIKNKLAYYKLVPAGVVVAITPFNFPLNLVAHKLGPAIAAGCSVVFKPSTKTPISGMSLVEAFYKAGLPENAIQTVIGSGSTVGKAIVSHETPRVITFTGSKDVGEYLTKVAGLKRVCLELGSNSAVYIEEDADLDRAVPKITKGGYALAGQVCISVQRVYVNKNIYSSFLEMFKNSVEKLKIGNPMKDDTDMGPMIDEAAIEKALFLIKDAKKRGGKVITGGERKGNFVLPTIIAEVPEDAEVIRKEAFSPIVVVNPVDGIEEGIERINNSDYGLQASIYTSDLKKSIIFTEKVEAGGVLVNEIPTFRVDIMPYGGVKGSGIGREGPQYAIEEMTEKKLIIMDYS